MAQFYTNFRNESVGGAPSELSILFGASDITMTTQTGNILAESDVSVLMSPSAGNTYARAAVQVGGVTTSGETTVRLLAQWQRATPAAVGSIVGGFVSGSGNDASRTGYYQWYRRDHAISKYDNGTDSAVATVDEGSASDANVRTGYLEIYRNAGLIEIRQWLEGTETRPAAPDVSYTDPSPLAVSGALGISALLNEGASSPNFTVYEVTVATDGDPILESDPTLPTITDVNTTNEVGPGTTATITGENLTNTTGVTVGGVAQTAVTVVSATSVTFTVVRGGNPYNQNLTAELTSTDGTASITVQQVPESGTFAVTAASPNTTDDASLWTGLVDTATSNPVTIVDGDQAWVKNPNNLTNLAVSPSGTISADVEGEFVVQIWLASEGTWGSDQTVGFAIPPQGAVTIGSVTVGTTTASVPFTYDDTDQDGFEYSLNSGAWTAATSPISLSGLTDNTTYSIAIRAFNAGGTSTQDSTTFTTDEVVAVPAGVITFGTPTTSGSTIDQPFTYDAADQTGFEYRVDGGTWVPTGASPVSLTGLNPGTSYSISVRAVNSGGSGTTYSTSVTTDAALNPPGGDITFGSPTITQTTISQPFTYNASDQTGFEYRVDGGAWTATTSPISLSGLTLNTSYLIEARAVNADGGGVVFATNVTTASLSPPQGVITYGAIVTTTTAATVPFTYDDTDQTGFEYSLNGGAWQSTTSPVGLTGLSPGTTYTLNVRAINADGAGASYPVTFLTKALSPPKGTVTLETSTVGQTTISLPFSYSATDQTGFEYQVNGGAWTPLAQSPVALTGLANNTAYTIGVRAVNAEGSGPAATVTITTLAEQTTLPGQTSGAYAFNMSVDDIIEEAYERIGMEVSSGYDLRTARRSLNLLLTEWVNKEITLWTMERRSIQCVAGQAEYELREYDVDVLEVALRTSGADTVLSRVSWHESSYTPDKDRQGRPIQYKFDRQIVPKLVLWPVPDTSTLSLVVDVFKYIEDVGSYINVVGAPRRFLPAMVAGLAYLLAEKKAPAMVVQKKQMYDELLMQALAADEEVKSFTIRPAGSRTRYR